MLRWAIETGIKFRLLVVALAAGVLALGVIQLQSTRVDALPEFNPPYVEIQTEALGLSAAEVEQLITVPLEADLLNGVAFLDEIRSDSVPGLSSVVMIFEPGTDLYRARQLVAEKMTQSHALPNVSKPPVMLEPLSSSSRAMALGMSSDRLSLIEQSVLARWTIRPRLMGVPGVSNVVGVRAAGSPAAGAGRPGPAERPRRRAERGDQDNRQRHLGLPADLPGGLDPGHRRLHRHPEPAAVGAERLADRGRGLARPGRGRGPPRAAPRRRRHRRRGPPAAHRRRHRGRRERSDDRHREVAGREHARGHPRRRGGAA